MKKILLALIPIVLVVTFVFGRSLIFTPSSKTGEPLKVVTSFYPLYYFTSQLSGDNLSLTNITPVGTEPHEYEPSPKDMALIMDSQLVVLNGGGFEPWAGAIDPTKTSVINTGENLISKEVVEDGKKTYDPHVWLAPRLAKRQAERILEGLLRLDPDNEARYKKRGQILASRFDELDRKFTSGLKNCQRRDFVTSHTAFSYLAEAYGLNQVAISGISPDEEPSLRDLAQIADFARKNNLKYIFFETLVSPKLSETLAREVRAQTLVLDPLEGLSPESMQAGKNYFTIMESNLTNLRTALACQ